jgi:nucleoside-diphosphate-sugar epimerase
MMAHLLNWRGDAKIVFTSTSEVYHGNGNINLPVREDYPILFPYIDDRWSYAYAKYGCEQMLTGDYVIARLCNTYGPDMCHNYVVKAQIQRILNGEDITVINPDDTRPFTYVSDIVSGLVHLMNTDMESQVYNLGSPISYTIMNMTERLVAMTGDQVKVERGPQGALEQRGPSIRKLFEETGWQPKVGLTEGLQQTWEWYYGNNSSN